MTTITLSFDNGPDPDVTPSVLGVLGRMDVGTTFFVLGDKLRDRRHLAERAREEGHRIGNHTFNHLVPLGEIRTPGAARMEIADTQKLIGDLAGQERLFRPFGGGGHIDARLLNREAFDFLRHEGYTCVLWNAIPQDWIYPEEWVEKALSLCFAQEHALLVLHDIPTGAMKHLERFIDEARARGATFVQEFPQSCLPIRRGELVLPMDGCISG